MLYKPHNYHLPSQVRLFCPFLSFDDAGNTATSLAVILANSLILITFSLILCFNNDKTFSVLSCVRVTLISTESTINPRVLTLADGINWHLSG